MSAPQDRRPCEDWWRTSIIEMPPGVIRYRGYPSSPTPGSRSSRTAATRGRSRARYLWTYQGEERRSPGERK